MVGFKFFWQDMFDKTSEYYFHEKLGDITFFSVFDGYDGNTYLTKIERSNGAFSFPVKDEKGNEKFIDVDKKFLYKLFKNAKEIKTLEETKYVNSIATQEVKVVNPITLYYDSFSREEVD